MEFSEARDIIRSYVTPGGEASWNTSTRELLDALELLSDFVATVRGHDPFEEDEAIDAPLPNYNELGPFGAAPRGTPVCNECGCVLDRHQYF